MKKNKLWGGRFKEELDPLVLEFTKSINYDWFLFEYEARSNIAWVNQLYQLKIFTKEQKDKIIRAINEILRSYLKGEIKIDFKEEDVHSFFYNRLEEKVGNLIDKIHTGKSRNEQITNIMRMFLKDGILEESTLVLNLQRIMLKKSEENFDLIIPGFTHLQFAQPVLFSHWLLSYVEELERDKQRLLDCIKRIDILSLGSGALAGSNFKIDREKLKRDLRFSKIGRNSIDMVSDRDFILEYLNANLLLLLHLSRLSEDLIIYNSPGYGFISFSDKITTGSSLMPHKKNPDPLELVRSSCSEALSNYVCLANILKGLPTAYNRDLQLDKKALFNSYLISTDVLAVITIVISEIYFDKEKLSQLLSDEELYLTDISEELIKQGLSWREAHRRVGKLIKYSQRKGKKIRELNHQEIKRLLGKQIDLENFFNPLNSVRRKGTLGSTNPKKVLSELTRWKNLLY